MEAALMAGVLHRVLRVQATVERTTGSKLSGQQRRPEEISLNSYALLQAYMLIAVTGLGYLALTWATVVLLGGFVTTLGTKDFWCLTAISMVQAARIFNDSGDSVFPQFLKLTKRLGHIVLKNPIGGLLLRMYRCSPGSSCFTIVGVLFFLIIVGILSIVALFAVLISGIVYFLAPVACIGLSVWRIRQRDYGINPEDSGKANLAPALQIFYSLVICQGALFITWYLSNYAGLWTVVSLCEECKLPKKWGSKTIVDYLNEIRVKCWKDPASMKGRNLISYAVDLLDSESQKDYLSGARILDSFIKMDADVRSLLLPSRPKIQKLIDTLGWKSSNIELREVVARIVADLAGDIHLSQFPGAIRCISSLLDTTLPYWNNQQEPNHNSPQSKSKDHYNLRDRWLLSVRGIEERRRKETRYQEGDAQQDWNELILQGLIILERLAGDQQNCRDICRTPGLLPKITAPLHSKTLIKDIEVSEWVDIVNGSLKVVHKLLRAPEGTGEQLVREISSSKQALSNLENFLKQSRKDGKELQMRAIEILTELALRDQQNKLNGNTKEHLIEKQLQIFLTEYEGEEEFVNKLKVMAGKTLALLSNPELLSRTGSTIAEFITSKHSDIVNGLTQMLDAKNKIIYRTIAGEILENLCSHEEMDKEHVKNILLPKVLTEVLTSQREPTTVASQSNIFSPRNNEENQCVSAHSNNEKKQEFSAPRNDEENQLSGHKGHTIKSSGQANEQQRAEMEMKEALLSLTWVIWEKQIISTNDFDEVVRKIAPGEGEFVVKLKIVVKENCEATPNSLRIVKLCGQLAVTMMRRSQYMAHFKHQKFVETLSKASRIMCNLESCMLFAGTDGGPKRTVRPLLLDLVKEAQAMVA